MYVLYDDYAKMFLIAANTDSGDERALAEDAGRKYPRSAQRLGSLRSTARWHCSRLDTPLPL